APEMWFRVLGAWIPEAKDEVLVDVADYSHVEAGPVTLLAGHDANYCMDRTDHRLGLLYDRKRPLDGDFSVRLRTAFRAALVAGKRLEDDPLLEGRARFGSEDILFLLNDRLNAPNTEETFSAVRKDLEEVLDVLYGQGEYTLTHNTDPKQRFSVHIRAGANSGLSSLLQNLDGNF
ncbi:MAG: hypothetical protein O2954_12600, partial [bacterium]|nr:hypothetical protein [bacterium]